MDDKDTTNDLATMPHADGSVLARVRNSRPHDAVKLRISLKQWRMLHAVIDCGGFADAAKFLHISQSAISYTVAKMQEQLGVPILKLVGRKAHVTDAGRELLEQSRYLLKEALALESFADTIRHGGESEVRLVVDHDFPTSLLMIALRQFSQPDCGIRVCLSEVTTQHAIKALNEHGADLAITSCVPPDFVGDPLMEIEYVAVAHAEHSLVRLGRTVTACDLKRHVRIMIGNAQHPLQAAGRATTPGTLQHWSVSSFDTAMEALRECLGYAWLPRHRIRTKLLQGELKLLPLADGMAFKTNFYLIHGQYRGPDSGAGKLARALHGVAAMEIGLYGT